MALTAYFDLETIATVIRSAVDDCYGLTLCGYSWPKLLEIRAEVHNPKVGDWVIETSTFGVKGRPNLDAVGVLEEIAQEPVRMEWDEAVDGPRPTERIVYLRTLDGRRFRWENASFVAAPTGWAKRAGLL